eukprot:11793033-Alexandrium_andersonii.AAC.1
MSASLVGSEMCIRDRWCSCAPPAAHDEYTCRKRVGPTWALAAVAWCTASMCGTALQWQLLCTAWCSLARAA